MHRRSRRRLPQTSPVRGRSSAARSLGGVASAARQLADRSVRRTARRGGRRARTARRGPRTPAAPRRRVAQPAQLLVDVGAGTDVEAAGRLGDDERTGSRDRARASSTFCMLPPDRPPTASCGSARMSNSAINRRACWRTRRRCVNPQRRKRSRSSSTRFCSTVRSGTTLPRRSSVIRPSPARMRPTGSAAVTSTPSTWMAARGRHGDRAQHVDELGLAVAADPGDADDLASRRRADRHVVEAADAVPRRASR